MIITRVPFRVSFCGGGSDLPAFYEKEAGCVISTTIKKYMYITIHKNFFSDQIVLKYSKTEKVDNVDSIEHMIFKQCLKDFKINGVEISSVADVPAGTGLGSSSSFTVALLELLHAYKGEYASKADLAKEACNIEINELKKPIGKQDQYAAAFGGLNYYEFLPNGDVNVEPIVMKEESYKKLERNLMLFYIGDEHQASEILIEQSKNMAVNDKFQAQRKMCEITRKLKMELQNNNVDALGKCLHENWILKKSLANGISNPYIDSVYEKAINAGALGGKLLGAGGAGFMLFYVPEDKQGSVRTVLNELREMKFEMDNSGASIIHFDR